MSGVPRCLGFIQRASVIPHHLFTERQPGAVLSAGTIAVGKTKILVHVEFTRRGGWHSSPWLGVEKLQK